MDTSLADEFTPSFWVVTLIYPMFFLWVFMKMISTLGIEQLNKKRKGRKPRYTAIELAAWFALILLMIYIRNPALPIVFQFCFTRDLLLIGGLWISGCAACLFSILMPRRTLEGRLLLDQIEGFEMYLEAAEKNRLEKLYTEYRDAAPVVMVTQFENILPYAFALGLHIPWTKAYSAVLNLADYKPRWYAGDFNVRKFASDLSAFSGLIRPSSSSRGGGGGGGGFSGGGFGGGGGRGR